MVAERASIQGASDPSVQWIGSTETALDDLADKRVAGSDRHSDEMTKSQGAGSVSRNPAASTSPLGCAD